MSLIEEAYGARKIIRGRHLSRSRRCKSRIEKPKVVKGDRLVSQGTLMDPILNVLTIDGEPSPFFNVADFEIPRTTIPTTATIGSTTGQYSPLMEEWMKQMNANNMQFQQNLNAIIQDLKMQVGQLATWVSQLQSTGFGNLSSQTIPNPKGGVSVVTLRSGRELPQKFKPKPRPARVVPLPFPAWTVPVRKSETDEDLLKMFWRVEINIPLLNAIKQIPKHAKFLKELCMHKRKKLKGGFEMGGVVSKSLSDHNKSCQRSVETLEFSLFHAPLAIVPLQIRFLCARYGGQNIWERIYLDSGMTVFYDCENKDRRACRDPFNGIQ
ncbi:hypothetical protein CR513_47449, partial [Mucuna pruriens]